MTTLPPHIQAWLETREGSATIAGIVFGWLYDETVEIRSGAVRRQIEDAWKQAHPGMVPMVELQASPCLRCEHPFDRHELGVREAHCTADGCLCADPRFDFPKPVMGRAGGDEA